jgi:hypothetical protein
LCEYYTVSPQRKRVRRSHVSTKLSDAGFSLVEDKDSVQYHKPFTCAEKRSIRRRAALFFSAGGAAGHGNCATAFQGPRMLCRDQQPPVTSRISRSQTYVARENAMLFFFFLVERSYKSKVVVAAHSTHITVTLRHLKLKKKKTHTNSHAYKDVRMYESIKRKVPVPHCNRHCMSSQTHTAILHAHYAARMGGG